MSKSKSIPARRLSRIGLATGAATALVLAGTSIPAYAVASATVSPAVGPDGGGNTVTVSTTTANSAEQFFAGTTFVQMSVAACEAKWQTPDVALANGSAPGASAAIDTGLLNVPAANVRIFSKNKLLVTVPDTADLPAASASRRYAELNFCVYDFNTNADGDLIAKTTSAPYKIAEVATVDTSTVTPVTGPAQGGDTLTFTGTNLRGATVTLDGITVTRDSTNENDAATNNTRFIGTVPPHSAGGPLTLIVSSLGGNKTTYAGVFTYSNGIRIAPNTAPNTKKTPTDVDVTGVGFAGMNWTGTKGGGTPNSATAHVYLAKGVYDPTSTGTSTYLTASKANGQVAECMDVVLIDDTEVICSLYLAGNNQSARMLQGLASRADLSATTASTTATTMTVTGGTLTANDVGAAVLDMAGAATGLVITAVTSPTTATLNKAPGVAVSNDTITLYPPRTINITRTAGSPNITVSGTGGNTFLTTTDVGRVVTGPGIPANTTIATVTNSTTAALSGNATTTVAAGAATIGPVFTETPVPNGTYTMTVVNNGAADAQTSTTFQKSIISSGSTFTVADY